LGTVTHYDAYLSFEDYGKIFAFMRWRCPVSFHVYGNPYVEGIEGYCEDGTNVRMSLLQIRDALDRHWGYLKNLLQEEDQPDLGKYSEEIGGEETLSLNCRTLVFKTGQATCCGFDRIWGRLK